MYICYDKTKKIKKNEGHNNFNSNSNYKIKYKSLGTCVINENNGKGK